MIEKESDWRSNLLWIDGGGGLAVGVVMFVLLGWLVEFHHLPRELLILMGSANLAYGTFSSLLASRSRRHPALIKLLVAANIGWATLCFRWAVVYADTASGFGMAHLIGEGLYVGGLGCLEWRWRGLLTEA